MSDDNEKNVEEKILGKKLKRNENINVINEIKKKICYYCKISCENFIECEK